MKESKKTTSPSGQKGWGGSATMTTQHQPTADATTIEPTDAALAERAGVDLADLTNDDLAELRAARQADEARSEPAPVSTGRQLVQEANGNTSPVAISLILEAGETYGVSPYADVEPTEILAWRFYPGHDEPGRVSPDAVVFVTAGGLKIKHYDDPAEPMDPETQDRLRRVFGCFTPDPNDPGKVIVLPLPANLHLPAVAVTGNSGSNEHQYPGGYLRAGGREAADEKERRRQARQLRFAGSHQN
jgi:hypothetical protein